MTNIRTTLAALFALLVGCTLSPEQKADNWLDGTKETIDVRINAALPNPKYQVHKSRAGKGASEGAVAGALGSLEAGVWSGHPLGLLLGVVLMPVIAAGGAVVGGAAAEPQVTNYPLSKVEGAEALIDAVFEDANLKELLAREISARSTIKTGHALRVVSLDTHPAPGAANLLVTVRDYALVGELEADPRIRLLVRGDIDFQTPSDGGWYSCGLSYEGAGRKLSKWSASDAKLFRKEVQKAAKEISQDILAILNRTQGKCLEKDKRRVPYNYGKTEEKKEAVQLSVTELRELAASGRADEQYKLARQHYSLTFDVPKSERWYHASETWYWSCLAAHNGHALAQNFLGFLRSWDTTSRPTAFIPTNLERAYVWYSLSASSGRVDAIAGKARISDRMTAAEIDAAERQLSNWKSDPSECITIQMEATS